MEFMDAPAGNAGVERDDQPSRWVWLVRRQMEASAEELGAMPKVFDVPKLLRETKLDAYSPQHFAIGPYHYQRHELKDMQRYKLAAVKYAEEHFDLNFDDLVDKFVGMQQDIRALYHRFLEVDKQTLGVMMAIDTCFLLAVMESYHVNDPTDMVSSSSSSIQARESWVNLIVRDVMMLENQIPLFLFKGALLLRHSSEEDAQNAMRVGLDRFITEVSPIKTTAVALAGNVAHRVHLLDLLYSFIVPVWFAIPGEDAEEVTPPVTEQLVSVDVLEPQIRVNQACMQLSRLNIAPVLFIKRNLTALSNLPGWIMSKVPLLSPLQPILQKAMGSKDVQARILQSVNMGGSINSPLVNEIKIPSVEQLVSCGVRLVPAPEGMAGINFDAATATLALPIIYLDDNTEVILRNLVAYETAALSGKLVMARYTELMNGIIDTPKDVKILRECKIICNGMKSDKEAADMWNGMCRAVRPSKVSEIDVVIKKVNAYRNSRASVKARKLMKRYVFRSWKILTLLATLVLLTMTALQTFCTAYDCKHWFGGILSQLPPPAAGGQ